MEVTRLTATRYLNVLVGMGLLQKVKVGRTNFYLNEPLFELLRAGTAD
jgi:Fic family protein